MGSAVLMLTASQLRVSNHSQTCTVQNGNLHGLSCPKLPAEAGSPCRRMTRISWKTADGRCNPSLQSPLSQRSIHRPPSRGPFTEFLSSSVRFRAGFMTNSWSESSPAPAQSSHSPRLLATYSAASRISVQCEPTRLNRPAAARPTPTWSGAVPCMNVQTE